MYTTRPSRMHRNRKYASTCTGRHEYDETGHCLNCNHVNKRKYMRWQRAQRQETIAQKLTQAVQSLRKKADGVAQTLEKKN